MTDQESLRYRDVWGGVHTEEFTVGAELTFPGATLYARSVVAPSGQRLVQKLVPADRGATHPGDYQKLDREIRVLALLGQLFATHYPAELVRLFGYNTDVEEPFILVSEYRGEPAEVVAGVFDDEQRRRFQLGVLHALQHTAYAGFVHGAIGIASLRWDGTTAQLVDFEAAGQQGEPRHAHGHYPRQSAEQVAGTGKVHLGDDIWGMGLVFRQLRLGEFVGTGVPGLGGSDQLRAQLGDVFAEVADRRPSVEVIADRLRATSDIYPDADPDDALQPGREAFDRANRIKRGEPDEPLPEQSWPAEKPSAGGSSTAPLARPTARISPVLLVGAAVVMLAVLAVVVMVVVNR